MSCFTSVLHLSLAAILRERGECVTDSRARLQAEARLDANVAHRDRRQRCAAGARVYPQGIAKLDEICLRLEVVRETTPDIFTKEMFKNFQVARAIQSLCCRWRCTRGTT